jgi:Protein of unknown function (DUF3800)
VSALLAHVWGVSHAQDRVWAQVTGLAPSVADKRLLMVFQAFIDDSATENGVFVLAGHIASAELWARFSKSWEELLPFGLLSKDGKRYFKMSEMAASPERMERVGVFFRVLEEYELLSISCKLNAAELKKAISRLWVLNRRFDWGPFSDPYFVAFRILIDSVGEQGDKMMSWLPDEKIDFIFDDQSQKKIIYEAWDAYMASKEPDVRKQFGSTPRFENDNEFMPLQAADLWAWWVRKWYESGILDKIDESKAMVVPGLINSNTIRRSVFISYNEDQLVESLKSMLCAMFPTETIYDSKFDGAKWP